MIRANRALRIFPDDRQPPPGFAGFFFTRTSLGHKI